MNTKKMREELKALGEKVPRSNKDVKELYKLKFSEMANESADINDPLSVANETKQEVGEVYTYVGAGHEPPQVINFMGKQVFKRGEPTVITDESILRKVRSHKCFMEGEVSGEFLIKQDEIEAKIYEQKVNDDLITQMNAIRTNR